MATYPPPQPDRRAYQRAMREQVRLQRLQLRLQRPSSLLGPLLLISIGVFALLIELGHINSPHALDLLARWWPLLLVGAGLVRLAEWIADQRRRENAVALGQPYAPRALGSGVVLLLLALIVAGIVSNLVRHNPGQMLGRNFDLNQDDWNQFVGDKHEGDTTLEHICPDGTVLTVDSPRGDITVSGTSTDGQMHLSAHTTVFTLSDADAGKRTAELAPKLRSDGNQLGVTIPSGNGARVDLTITLPPTTTLVLHDNQGDVSVHVQQAPVTIIANHGDVEANDITGPLTVHINKSDSSLSAHNDRGGITLEGRAMDLTLSDIAGPVSLSGEFFGTVHLERSGSPVHLHTGRIDLELGRVDGNLELTQNADLTADGIVGPVTVNTRNRNVRMERVSGTVSITNRNGSVTLSATPPLADITVQNRTGEVNVTLPTNAGFSLDAGTIDGDLTNDFGLNPTEDHDRSRVTGTVGSGGPAVHLETTQADLSVQRGSLAALPPPAPLPSVAPVPAPASSKHATSSPQPTPHPDVTF